MAKETPLPRKAAMAPANLRALRAQIARLERMRKSRDQAACDAALSALTEVAETGDGNILAAVVEAARARASVGEISDAMEKAWGRHKAETHLISDVYEEGFEGDENWAKLTADISDMERTLGRKPRLMVVKMGQDGHDRGAKVIATAFEDMGFDVVVGPLFQTPEEAADMAVAEDVDVVGISSHAAGHKTLAPMLLDELAKRNAADKIVICGGVIPAQDYEFLKEAGVTAIYGPGTNILESATSLLGHIREKFRGRNYAAE